MKKERPKFLDYVKAIGLVTGLFLCVAVFVTFYEPPSPRTAEESLRTFRGRADRKSMIRDAVATLAWGNRDTFAVVVYEADRGKKEHDREWKQFLDTAAKRWGRLSGHRYAEVEVPGRVEKKGRVTAKVHEFRVDPASGKHIFVGTRYLTLIYRDRVWLPEKFEQEPKARGPAIETIAGLLFFVKPLTGIDFFVVICYNYARILLLKNSFLKNGLLAKKFSSSALDFSASKPFETT